MVLPKLVEMGLVIKIDRDVRGIHLCEYKVSPVFTGCECHSQGGCERDAHNNIEKENIDINTLAMGKGPGRFKKPSLDEIREYCLGRGNKVDPEQFYNFYESNGWKVGKNPMKDWRAAVRTWEKREKEVAPRKRESVRESAFARQLRSTDQLLGTNYYQQAYGKREDYDEQ